MDYYKTYYTTEAAKEWQQIVVAEIKDNSRGPITPQNEEKVRKYFINKLLRKIKDEEPNAHHFSIDHLWYYFLEAYHVTIMEIHRRAVRDNKKVRLHKTVNNAIYNNKGYPEEVAAKNIEAYNVISKYVCDQLMPEQQADRKNFYVQLYYQL